jgi:hypothetical protein
LRRTPIGSELCRCFDASPPRDDPPSDILGRNVCVYDRLQTDFVYERLPIAIF